MPRIQNILLVLAALIAMASLFETFLSAKAWPHHTRLQHELESLQEDNAHILQNITEQRRALQALRTRPEVQEHVIRSELGYVRDNDVILNTQTP